MPPFAKNLSVDHPFASSWAPGWRLAFATAHPVDWRARHAAARCCAG